jgi:hypothetical protein
MQSFTDPHADFLNVEGVLEARADFRKVAGSDNPPHRPLRPRKTLIVRSRPKIMMPPTSSHPITFPLTPTYLLHRLMGLRLSQSSESLKNCALEVTAWWKHLTPAPATEATRQTHPRRAMTLSSEDETRIYEFLVR